MAKHLSLDRAKTALLIIDVQEKLFKSVERSLDVLHHIQLAVKGFLMLNVPIAITEQYTKGLGSTLPGIRDLVPNVPVFEKRSFSCVKQEGFENFLSSFEADTWVLCGIETHVCILQSARDLLNLGKKVVILNDATSSRSIFDFSTAIAELRDMGARITSTETALFELIETSSAPEFKQLSELIK